MATQVFGSKPNGQYVVIDDGTPGVTSTVTTNWSPATIHNFDQCVAADYAFGGATSQGQIPISGGNGTIPNFLASGTTTVINSGLTGTRVLFRNPA